MDYNGLVYTHNGAFCEKMVIVLLSWGSIHRLIGLFSLSKWISRLTEDKYQIYLDAFTGKYPRQNLSMTLTTKGLY